MNGNKWINDTIPLKPNLTRLKLAQRIGQHNFIRSEWRFDARVFRCIPKGRPSIVIGNLPGYLASMEPQRDTGFGLQPMTGGVAVVKTSTIIGMVSDATVVPGTVPTSTRWNVDNICYRNGREETFGWGAVCEYFSLGMWDAKRIFQGYGAPETPTLASTLHYLDTFIGNRS